MKCLSRSQTRTISVTLYQIRWCKELAYIRCEDQYIIFPSPGGVSSPRNSGTESWNLRLDQRETLLYPESRGLLHATLHYTTLVPKGNLTFAPKAAGSTSMLSIQFRPLFYSNLALAQGTIQTPSYPAGSQVSWCRPALVSTGLS